MPPRRSKGKKVTPSQVGKVWNIRNCGESEEDPHLLLKNPYNPRRHNAEQLALFREFVASFGFLGRVIVNRRNNHIIEGEMRTEIAKLDKQPAIPVQWVDIATEKEERAILNLYNQVGEMAILDRLMLGQNMEAVRDEIGELAAAYLAQLPDLQTIGEQLLESGDALFDDDGKGGDLFKLYDDESDDDLFDPEAALPAKKKGMVKITLTGDPLEEFRRLLSRAGKLGEVGNNSVVMVIMGR